MRAAWWTHSVEQSWLRVLRFVWKFSLNFQLFVPELYTQVCTHAHTHLCTPLCCNWHLEAQTAGTALVFLLNSIQKQKSDRFMSMSFSHHTHFKMATNRRLIVKEVCKWAICGWLLLGRWNLVWQVKMNLCVLMCCSKDTCLVKMKYISISCECVYRTDILLSNLKVHISEIM
jgi:hypothetical protein